MIDDWPMSLFELLYIVVTTLGFLALSFQLWLQRRQTTILTQTVKSGSDSSVAQRQLQVDTLFLEKPHLVEYFLRRQMPEPGRQEEALAMGLLLLNYFDTYFLQRSSSSQLWGDIAWHSYMAMFFKNSPFLCHILKNNRHLYTADLYHFHEMTILNPPPKGLASDRGSRAVNKRPPQQSGQPEPPITGVVKS